jgi:CO/xanthine dehydrogenase Mo-binding subunit
MPYKYWLGKETPNVIGKYGQLGRKDAMDKVTAKAVYTRDVKLPGMLYGRCMTSPYANAVIKSMDTTKAAALPGVRAILRYDDPWVKDNPLMGNQAWRGQPHYLLGSKAVYWGLTVGVAIAADTPFIADEALKLVNVTWQEFPCVLNYEDAIKPTAPVIWSTADPGFKPDIAGYGLASRVGAARAPEFKLKEWDPKVPNLKLDFEWELEGSNMEAGFKAADKTVQLNFVRDETNNVAPETMSCVAYWGEDGRLQTWVHTQASRKATTASNLAVKCAPGITSNDVLEQYPYGGMMGGGWNWATNPGVNCIHPLAAMLAKKANAPVKLLFTRQEEFFYSQLSWGSYNLKVGVKNDGTITAVDLTYLTGITAEPGKRSCLGMGHLAENTRIPNQHGFARAAWVNRQTPTSARCEQDGNAYVMTMAFAMAADAIGKDPTTIALMNDGAEGHDMVWLADYKKQHDIPTTDSLAACLTAGKKAVDWDNKWHAPGTKKLANGRYHGIGFTWDHEWQNGAPPPGSGTVFATVHASKKVLLTAQHPDVGVNHRVLFCMCAAEELGLAATDIDFLHISEVRWSEFNTSLPAGLGSIGSSTGEWPVIACARNLRAKVLDKAATQLKVTADKLDIKDGTVFEVANPTNKVAFFSVSGVTNTNAYNDNPGLVLPSASDLPSEEGGGIYLSRQCHFLEVEVDADTGEVFITNNVDVNDVGQAISPESCITQIDGGIVMGMGKGMTEGFIYDPQTGVKLNANLIDYKPLTILDMGTVTPVVVQCRLGYGPYGSAGLGESNATLPNSLCLTAIYNAIGKWVEGYPPSPDRVLKALGKG